MKLSPLLNEFHFSVFLVYQQDVRISLLSTLDGDSSADRDDIQRNLMLLSELLFDHNEKTGVTQAVVVINQSLPF